MNTQELKKYINRVLGNKIRCLLPSYWWKRLFNQVADRIDEVEQSTSKLIESKVEEIKMPIVESVDDLENLKLAKGRVAAVEKTGESATVKISDCYSSLNWEEDWGKYTIVKGVEEKDVILDKDVTAYVIFSASKGNIDKDAIQVIVQSGRFLYVKVADDKTSITSLEYVNKALSNGKYRAIHYSNAPDDYFTFYLAKPQPSLYIKGDSWEMLTKENVVNSEDELDRLIVPYGSIAKVNSKKYGKINPFNCYRIISTSQPSSDAVKRNWDKLKRITQIDVTNPDTEPSSLPTMYLHGYANFNGDLIQISYYNGYKIATSNGSTTVASFDDLNSLLKNSDYRLLAISDTDEHREFFDKYVSLYSPDFIVPNAYIKGETWERLAKEYVASSEEELNALSVENGTIARVVREIEPQAVKVADCYLINNTDNYANEWDKFTVIKKIEETDMNAESSNILYICALNESFTKDAIGVGYDHGVRCYIRIVDGVESPVSLDIVNDLLATGNYRLVICAIAGRFDSYFTFYTEVAKDVSDAYIKGETWTRLLKEGDVTGGGSEIRELYIGDSLTDEQKAWNLETLELAKQGKAIVRTTLHGNTFILELFNEDNEYQFGYTQFSPSGGVAISVYVAEDGLSGIKIEESHFDSELSDTSINAVQNKVVTAALNNKVDKNGIKTINGVSLLGGGNLQLGDGQTIVYDDTEVKEVAYEAKALADLAIENLEALQEELNENIFEQLSQLLKDMDDLSARVRALENK